MLLLCLLLAQGDGKCSAIPQALDATSAATACASKRSCATALPTAVGGGLLWVWPDAAPTAAQEAAATGESKCTCLCVCLKPGSDILAAWLCGLLGSASLCYLVSCPPQLGCVLSL
jgi:hypothetical protein